MLSSHYEQAIQIRHIEMLSTINLLIYIITIPNRIVLKNISYEVCFDNYKRISI